MTHNSISVSPASSKPPHPWAGECNADILHTACATVSTLHHGSVQYITPVKREETASTDVMCMQLKSATENVLNYLIPNKAWVSAGDNSSFR